MESETKVVELINVTKRFGETTAVDSVSLEVHRGETLSLLGPSGCGKTTTLRLIAGFEDPDEGTILISGRDMRGRRPYERNVGLLFQDYALFPHMTVEENISYGMRHRGMARAEVPERTKKMLELVKLNGFEKRRPSQLSGGQQQRVALARALAINPEVMLLDEPLSALDAKLRQELRVELKEILASVRSTTIVVTHDQEEAMSLADYVIVQNRGLIMQRGTPTEIYAHPRNKFVAEFIGRSNWFKGRLGAVLEPTVREFETEDGLKLYVANPLDLRADHCAVCVRQERIKVRPGEPDGGNVEEPLNIIRAIVVDSVHLGADAHITAQTTWGLRLSATEKNVGQRLVQKGEPITLSFGAQDCIVLPDDE